MEQQIRFCTTSDGVRIAYATVGQGPPLIVAPGWVSHLEFAWENPVQRATFERFAQHFLLVNYDKRGTGLSDRNVSDFSLDPRLLDLEAVVDHLKLREFALYGFSEGGALCIAYAARHPQQVSRIVLYGSYASPTKVGREAAVDAVEALVRAQWGLGSRTLSNIFMPGAPAEETEWFVRLQQVGATAEVAAAMLRADAEMNLLELLPRVRCPTLVVHARGDLVVPFELGREIASGVPNARLVPVESGRHLLEPDKWESMDKTIIDFLLEEERDREAAAPAAAPSGLVTVLFTDMEGSTTLTQRLGDAKAQEVLRAHNTIVRDALKAHGGSEIKHTGDGIMASFPSASRALECAIAVQRAVAAQVEEHPEMPLRVRIGLNAGEPVVEDQDLFGTAVQLAARICAHAEPGQIVVPTVVRELAAGKGFLLADLGEVALRGFEDPVRLYEVRWREEA
jgi:class 3 adenylate cyclase